MVKAENTCWSHLFAAEKLHHVLRHFQDGHHHVGRSLQYVKPCSHYSSQDVFLLYKFHWFAAPLCVQLLQGHLEVITFLWRNVQHSPVLCTMSHHVHYACSFLDTHTHTHSHINNISKDRVVGISTRRVGCIVFPWRSIFSHGQMKGPTVKICHHVRSDWKEKSHFLRRFNGKKKCITFVHVPLFF